MHAYEIVFSKFAEYDLKEIIAYYNEINSNYGINLYKKIKNKILKLELSPKSGRIVPELEQKGILKYRQLIESNYKIIYKIEKSVVYILVIVDSRRNLEELLMVKLMERMEI